MPSLRPARLHFPPSDCPRLKFRPPADHARIINAYCMYCIVLLHCPHLFRCTISSRRFPPDPILQNFLQERFNLTMYKNVTFNSSNNSAISVSVLLHSSDVLMQPVVSDIDIGCRKGIQPVKNWMVGCWHGYLFGARCWLAHGPADANAVKI